MHFDARSRPCAHRRSRSAREIIEQVLVKVNGDIFTQTELEERQTAAIRARLGVDLKPMP